LLVLQPIAAAAVVEIARRFSSRIEFTPSIVLAVGPLTASYPASINCRMVIAFASLMDSMISLPAEFITAAVVASW
jgi:hypothetical protein